MQNYICFKKAKCFLIFLFFLSSCSCPECETFPEPLRIIFVDSDGRNLLESRNIVVKSITTGQEEAIEFAIKDFVIRDSKEKMHIEIFSGEFYTQLINSEDSFYFTYEDNTVDTLIYGITEVSGKCCNTYSDTKFIFNNLDLTGQRENTIGAYEILVE